MVLWGKEHQWRASNLAAVLGESVAQLELAAKGAIPVSADSTLTIWGHGGSEIFAEMNASALGDFIKAWKAKNPALKTVELVTCDARHASDNRDSFTDKLMPLLLNASKSKVLVNVMCLPRGGSTATTSELWATEAAGSNGYFFIAADSDAALAKGVQVWQDAQAAVPAGVQVSKFYEAVIPIVKAANDKAAMKGVLGYVTSGGVFSNLRGFLAKVTVYVEGSNRLAVPKDLTEIVH